MLSKSFRIVRQSSALDTSLRFLMRLRTMRKYKANGKTQRCACILKSISRIIQVIL